MHCLFQRCCGCLLLLALLRTLYYINKLFGPWKDHCKKNTPCFTFRVASSCRFTQRQSCILQTFFWNQTPGISMNPLLPPPWPLLKFTNYNFWERYLGAGVHKTTALELNQSHCSSYKAPGYVFHCILKSERHTIIWQPANVMFWGASYLPFKRVYWHLPFIWKVCATFHFLSLLTAVSPSGSFRNCIHALYNYYYYYVLLMVLTY